jgi:thiol-disulfide isomerase/thioredoxin
MVRTPNNAFVIFIAISPVFLSATTNCGTGSVYIDARKDTLLTENGLLVKHKAETNDDVARIAFMKAKLYLEVFKNTEKATSLLKQLQLDFPDTTSGKSVGEVLAHIKANEEAKKMQDALVVGSPFPAFDIKDIDGKPLSIANYKNKIVMIDFWATWCVPCRGEIPNIVKTYQKYHDKGFEIIGVSLDKAGDKDKLIGFTKENKMPWRQYFDGKGGQNEMAVKCGIQSIPMAFLLDGNGNIIAKGNDVRGVDENGDALLGKVVAKALGSQ